MAMPSFSQRSINNLQTCHDDLIKLFEEVIRHYDCAVICGHRSKEDQDKAYHEGKSKLRYPLSKHNKMPSLAVDVVPYPIAWDDLDRFYHFVGFVTGVAKTLGINIRSGLDWDGDLNFKDQNFLDAPHFELSF